MNDRVELHAHTESSMLCNWLDLSPIDPIIIIFIHFKLKYIQSNLSPEKIFSFTSYSTVHSRPVMGEGFQTTLSGP